MNAVLLGAGIACMSVSATLPQLLSGQLKLFLPDWRVTDGAGHYSGIHLQYPVPRYQPRRLQMLIDFLMAHSSALSEIDSRYFMR